MLFSGDFRPSVATSSLAGFKAEPLAVLPSEMIRGPEANIDYGLAALSLTKKYFPATSVQDGLLALDEIVARVRAVLSALPNPEDPWTRIAAINTVLYRDYGFHYDPKDILAKKQENRMLGTLLRSRSGTCANLPDLYYAVSQRLGFPISLVEAPQHAYLWYDLGGGNHINIEATSGGGESSDEFIAATLEVPQAAIEAKWMLRPLTKREALAFLVKEEAEADRRRGLWDSAANKLRLVAEVRPEDGGNLWNMALDEARRASICGNSGFLENAKELGRRAVALGAEPPVGEDYIKRQEALGATFSNADARLALVKPKKAWEPAAILTAVASRPNPEPAPEEMLARRRPPVMTQAQAEKKRGERALAIAEEVEAANRLTMRVPPLPVPSRRDSQGLFQDPGAQKSSTIDQLTRFSFP